MKRLNINTFMAEEGEILNFKEVFGVEPGEGYSSWRHFGNRRTPELNPTAVCIQIDPIDHTEVKFLFSAASGMANALGGRRDMIISTKPYAVEGDPENVAVMKYGYKEANGNLACFVNDKDESPAGAQYILKWVYKDGDRVQKQVLVDDGEWLKPHTTYYLTYRRVGSEFGNPANTPLSIFHRASDEPEEGGEVLLDVTNMIGNLNAIEVDLGPLGAGIFIPD